MGKEDWRKMLRESLLTLNYLAGTDYYAIITYKYTLRLPDITPWLSK